MAKDQELNAEIAVWATPIDEGLEEQADDRVEDGQKHGEPWWHVVGTSDPTPAVGVQHFSTPRRIHRIRHRCNLGLGPTIDPGDVRIPAGAVA